MSETMIIFIFSMVSYLLMGYLFNYLYKDSGSKYLLELSRAWYWCSCVFLIYCINEIMPLNEKYLLIIHTLTYVSIFFLIKAIDAFIKIKFVHKHRYILTLYIIAIVIFFTTGMIIFEKEIYSSCIFSAIISSGFLIFFYNWDVKNLKKYFVGDLFIFTGILFEVISMMKQSKGIWNIWTFVSITSIFIIGLGLVLCHYKKVKEELEINEKRYRLSIEASNSELWEYDIKENSITIPKKKYVKYTYEKPEYKTIIQALKYNVHQDDRQTLRNAFNEHLEGKTEKYNVEYRRKCSDGGYTWILSKGKALRDEKGMPIKVFGANTDISDIKKAQEKIRILGYYDSLTGLLKKNAFINELKEEVDKAKISKGKCAVFCIELDNFKLVNDTLGHAYGDEFLKIIGEELKGTVKAGDVIARTGGDEFTILQKNVNNIDEVKELVDLILEKFNKSWVVENYEFDITASIGIILCPHDTDNVEELLEKVDIAMRKSKSDGKNQCNFFKDYMNDELKHKVKMQKKLKKAVKNNEFSVHYQPQIDIITGKISGMEALVRWVNAEDGSISPNEFIPWAEEIGLIMPISEYVLRTACIKSKQWNSSRNSKLSISVNISVIQLNQINFVEVVKNILEETGLEPRYLTLEITESILIKSLESNIRKLENLRKLGIKIALDDFGTGYSSLSYIMNLPIDIVKIDKSFVDDITENSKKEVIIESIISLAQKINLQVVVEGVEVKEQYDILMKQNCDKIQGYYFSKPLCEEDFEKFITE